MTFDSGKSYSLRSAFLLRGSQLSRADSWADAELLSIDMLPVSAIGLRMVAAANLVEVAALVGVVKPWRDKPWRDKPCRKRRHQPSSPAQLHRKKQRVVEIRLMSLVASARHVFLLCQRIRDAHWSTPESCIGSVVRFAFMEQSGVKR